MDEKNQGPKQKSEFRGVWEGHLGIYQTRDAGRACDLVMVSCAIRNLHSLILVV